MTSDVLLASPRIRSLDSIEIEPAVLEAARGFGPRVHRVFGDPRSVLRSEDARTFFSRQAAPYDLIISEPSNPWVSGVASLFTEEFYHQVAARLTEHGLFVQWINLYEFNLRLLASVMGALGAAFDDYQVFNALDGNLLILSGRRPLPGRLDGSLFDDPALADELARLGFTSIAQLERRYLGARRDLEPWFAGFGVPGNSDYRPLVALQAPAARFLGQDAGALTWLQDAPLPVVGRRPVGPAPRPGSVATEYVVERGAVTARALAAYLDGSSDRLPRQQRLAHAAHQLARSMAPCGQPAAARILVDDLFSVAAATAPYLAPEELAGMWARLASRLCLDADMLPDRWLGLHWAVAAREADKARVLAEALLRDGGQDVDQVSYLLGAGLWAALSSNDRQAGRAFLAAHRERLPAPARQPHYLRVLLARLAKG
jgi:hypothetical protein